MKKIIREKISKTKYDSFKRIYIDGKEILDTDFKIGSKFSYEIDFESKKVRIVPNDIECNGTVSKKKRKYKDKEELIPVIDIHNKNIMKVFEGINKCKVTIYDDEILVEPLVEDNVADTLVSKVKKTCNNVIDIFTKKKPVKKIYRLPVSNLEYLIKCKAAGSFYEQISIDDFSFDLDVDLNSVVSATEQFERDKPILSDTLKVLSLFSGIGAFEKALANINVSHELIGFSEIDKYAIKSYCAIHDVDESLSLGDITKIDTSKIQDFDLLVGGSPCQDISIMRKTFVDNRVPEGLKGKESKLFFDYVRILNDKLPKYFIFENVRNLLFSNNGEDFKTVIELLGENYNIHHKLLNSCDYGIPQIRRRVFIVGKRKDLGEFNYEFPNPVKLNTTVQDLLEPKVDDKYYLTDKMYKTVMSTGTKGWYAKPETDCKVAKPLMKTMHKMHRASTDNYYHTEYKPKNKTNLRRLTPLECFRLQGFSNKDYKKVKDTKMSDTQMYIQTGNSITVTVIEKILKKLLPKKYFSNVVPLF